MTDMVKDHVQDVAEFSHESKVARGPRHKELRVSNPSNARRPSEKCTERCLTDGHAGLQIALPLEVTPRCLAKNKLMVRPERFELPTYSSGGCRSIHLSYGRVSVW
jgi:hypothetical protein